jgi:hypothetical protein
MKLTNLVVAALLFAIGSTQALAFQLQRCLRKLTINAIGKYAGARIMNNIQRYLTLILIGSASACSIPPKHGYVNEPRLQTHFSQHEVTDQSNRSGNDANDSPRFMSCDFTHDYNLSSAAIKIVPEAWPFALMASNSYHTNAFFEIPGWEAVSHYRGALDSGAGIGFQADTYVRRFKSDVVEVAVVFRGTDGPGDWSTTLSLWWPWSQNRAPPQFQHATWIVSQTRSLYPNAKMIFVGHSLGGGLAYHVGWKTPDARVFAFNTSPRIWSAGKPQKKTEFHDIAEKGEILRYVQFWRKLPGNKVRMNFREAGSIKDHNMYNFARSILYQATRQEIQSPPNTVGNKSSAFQASKENLGC